MKRLFLVAPVVFFLALVLPEGAVAATRTEMNRPVVTGEVVSVTPETLTVATSTSVEAFHIPAGSTVAAQLVPGDDVSVQWEAEARSGSRSVVRATHVPMTAESVQTKRENVSRAPQACESIRGQLLEATPDRLYVASNGRIDKFVVTRSQAVSDYAPGDDIQVFYRVVPKSVTPTVVACAPAPLMRASR